MSGALDGELITVATVIVDAAAGLLLAHDLPVPDRRYVSVQNGDWLPGQCADCCHQLVVTPGGITRAVTAGDPSRSTVQFTGQFTLMHSVPVNINVDERRPALGDATLPWDAPQNADSHLSEAGLILTARAVLMRHLPKQVTRVLCGISGMPPRACSLLAIDPWIEGGCGGSRVTVEVTL